MTSKLFFCISLAIFCAVTAVPAFSHVSDEVPLNVNKDTFEEWCDPVLGCLNITDAWYSSYRPINVLPATRDKINTRFYLHTNGEPNIDTDYIVTAEDLTSLMNSPYDPTKPTIFLSHGFINSGNSKWLKEMAASLLAYQECNVFRVDWGDGSMPMYFQATANTRVVGLEIGLLVNTITASSYALDPTLVHCIGHSLGSHVCGYAGEQITNLGRITGLDPAGPYFTGTPSFVHLDPSDAIYVDNLHTDADSIFMLGYGTAQPMGNMDFYPNSGHDQPGCDPVSIAIDLITGDMLGHLGDTFACSHLRAINYFADTLAGGACQWLAHECYDYESFENGACYSCSSDNSKCAYAGIRADEYVNKERIFGMFYFDTDPEGDQPYCMEHYQVSILTANPNEAETWVIGTLKISLYGDNGQSIIDQQITSKHERIDHGQVKNTLFVNHLDVGNTIRVELYWDYNDQVLNPGTWCWALICNKSLYVLSVQVSEISYYPESERLAHTQTYCSMDGTTTEIRTGDTESFLLNGFCEPIDGH